MFLLECRVQRVLMVFGLVCLLQSEAEECSIHRSKPYQWSSTCKGRPSFSPKITVKDVDVFQDGRSVKTASGIHLTKPLKIVLQLNSYTVTLTDPGLDLQADMLKKTPGSSGCTWQEVIGPGDIGGLNPCLAMEEPCTLEGNPKTLHMEVNLKETVGDALRLLPTNTLYAIEMTIKDDEKPVLCFRIEHKVLQG